MICGKNIFRQQIFLNAYYEVEQFIQKATNGQYSFDDINVDDNGKITGLPEKMCKIMNSQEANAKYEEIRDNIYMLTDYKNQYGLEDILAFKAGYNISDSEVSTVGTSGNNSVMDENYNIMIEPNRNGGFKRHESVDYISV